MPRRSRRLSASKIYHVMVRGNERKAIFLDDDDRAYFVSTLAMKKLEWQFAVYAYCLMDNHVHLVINEGAESISTIMKRIQVSYVYYFNKKYGRSGHLFQDRFKSEAVEDDQPPNMVNINVQSVGGGRRNMARIKKGWSAAPF